MDNGSSSAAGFGEDAATGISYGEHMALAYTCYSAFIAVEHHTYPVKKKNSIRPKINQYYLWKLDQLIYLCFPFAKFILIIV